MHAMTNWQLVAKHFFVALYVTKFVQLFVLTAINRLELLLVLWLMINLERMFICKIKCGMSLYCKTVYQILPKEYIIII